MTTVKVKFRPSTVEGRPGTIVYFVTHRRVVRQITTGYKVFSHEWDDKTVKTCFGTGWRTDNRYSDNNPKTGGEFGKAEQDY